MAIELITNRTQDDVTHWSDLRQAIIERTATDEQWREWLREMRGRYDIFTLNRVGQALIEVAALVTELYMPVSVSPKTNWTVSDIPTPAQMQHYLDDIEAIRSIVSAWDFVPSTPSTMNNLTYQMANDIEEILLIVRDAVIQVNEIYPQSGMYDSGGVWFFRQKILPFEPELVYVQSGQAQSGNLLFPITKPSEREKHKIYIQSGTVQSGYNFYPISITS